MTTVKDETSLKKISENCKKGKKGDNDQILDFFLLLYADDISIFS